MKYGQKLKLGGDMVQVSKLGDAPRHPFFIGKNQVIFQDTIFLLLCILCVFLGASLLLFSVFFCIVFSNKWFLESLYFCFQFSFVLFAVINGWTPTYFFWRRCTLFFIAKNILLLECSLFLVLRLAFVFHLDFCSDLVISLYQGVFRPLVYDGFHL
jgi:hypothetical protein